MIINNINRDIIESPRTCVFWAIPYATPKTQTEPIAHSSKLSVYHACEPAKREDEGGAGRATFSTAGRERDILLAAPQIDVGPEKRFSDEEGAEMCHIAPEALKIVMQVAAFSLVVLVILPGDHELPIVATAMMMQIAALAKIAACQLP